MAGWKPVIFPGLFAHILPVELEREISEYIYYPLLPDQRRDIEDFTSTLNQVLSLRNQSARPEHLLLNDLWRFSFVAFGDYYQLWRRLRRRPSRAAIKVWIGNCYALRSARSQSRLLWALLTPAERAQGLAWLTADYSERRISTNTSPRTEAS